MVGSPESGAERKPGSFSFDETAGAGESAAKSREQRTLEDVVTPEHLELISKASGGFRFEADPKLPPGSTGYTNKENRTIYYNPLFLSGSEEHGIKPWTRDDIHGFTYHEAGHHNPEVLEFDNELMKRLGDSDIVPEAYRGSPQAEARFHQALYSHLDNALVDVWLESNMSRRPYMRVREAITNFQSAKGEWESYKSISKPEQLMQILLRSRYLEQENLEQKVDSDVFTSYQKIMESGAMKTLMDRRDFENYFASPAQRERAIGRKVASYERVFLPEYLRLLANEVEERKEQRQQQKGEAGEPQEGAAEGGEPQRGPSQGAPLTKEEEEEISQQLLQELEEAGKEYQPLAPSPEEEQEIQQKMQQIKQSLEGKGEEVPTPEEETESPSGLENLRRLQEELQRKSQERDQQGLAESMKVKQESVQKWQNIKEKYRDEINSTASALAEVFLDDRRRRLEFMRRQGEVVPGLEYETVAAYLSGDLDPQTKMTSVRNPEFLETELEFIVDTSGSMSGAKLERSVEMMVVTTEAFKQVQETLTSENLLADDEHPFRVGVTTFSDKPERVTELDEPLSDQKELNIVDKASQVGGGTEETAAIKGVYEQLTLDKDNVIKMMVVLTDGYGNQAGVAPILRQIEEDDEVVFLAVGLGSSKEEAQEIVDTYVKPLQKREGNVYGHAAANLEELLPATTEFIRREVNKHRQF